MNSEQLARELDGQDYPLDLSKDDKRAAKDAGLVIVYGASDDLCELDGAISDEASCNDGGEILVNRTGVIETPDRDETEVLEKFGVLTDWETKPRLKFEAVWGGSTPDGVTCSWHYRVPFPHHTFDIMEDGELYCRGFVFNLNEVLPA